MKLDKCLSEDNINQNLLNIQYAVRGPILQRAVHIERELQKGVPKPFPKVVRANLGDAHSLGQKPITFIRQVLALAACPELAHTLDVPDDVRQRVKLILDDCLKGSVGSYSPSLGLRVVREEVARFLEARDGVPASPDDIYLGSGVSDLVKTVFSMLLKNVDGKPPAVMVPVPQYPLFSSTLSELGLRQVDFFLDEEQEWALQPSELERSWRQASEHSYVRAIVVINPGNPTGQVLGRENMEVIIKFAYEHGLLLVADEVYQDNIISKPFISFKKMIHELGAPYNSMELVSFVSSSKGWAAECGLRAGFAELVGVASRVTQAFATARSVLQCPSVLGQCILHCVVKPPAPGEPSYPQFAKEVSEIHQIMADRTEAAYDTFNSTPGFSCNPIDGAIFAYPLVSIPEAAQAAARDLNMTPDEFYCLRLLEETGICVTPGSGFGQQPDTFHFRTTVVHPLEEFHYMMDSFRRFHRHFLELYS